MPTRRILLPSRSLFTAVRRRSITPTCHATYTLAVRPPSKRFSSYRIPPQQLISRDFVSSLPTYKEGSATADGGEDDEPCPEWQNPLHHNNPEFQKILEEDFEPGEEMPTVPLPPFSSPDGGVDAPPHIHDLANEIIHLNLVELKSLMDRIGDHFGFDDTDAFGGGDAEEGGTETVAEVKEEKTTFDLKLEGFDAKAKIKVIKEIRTVTGLGLKEAKELVEGAPTTVKKDIKKEEAEELKAKLEAVGATVEIV